MIPPRVCTLAKATPVISHCPAFKQHSSKLDIAQRATIDSGVKLQSSRALTSAPRSSRHRPASSCPLPDRCQNKWRLANCALAIHISSDSPPRSSSNDKMLVYPAFDATCIGVTSNPSLAFTVHARLYIFRAAFKVGTKFECVVVVVL
jgi:hypothetical protein